MLHGCGVAVARVNVVRAGDAHWGTPKMFAEGKILGENARQDPPKGKCAAGPAQSGLIVKAPFLRIPALLVF